MKKVGCSVTVETMWEESDPHRMMATIEVHGVPFHLDAVEVTDQRTYEFGDDGGMRTDDATSYESVDPGLQEYVEQIQVLDSETWMQLTEIDGRMWLIVAHPYGS